MIINSGALMAGLICKEKSELYLFYCCWTTSFATTDNVFDKIDKFGFFSWNVVKCHDSVKKRFHIFIHVTT